MLHILPILLNETISKRLEITILSVLGSVRSVSGNATKLLTTHRPEETICWLWTLLIRCSLFFTIYGWKQEDVFHRLFPYFVLRGELVLYQQVVWFFLLSSITNIRANKIFATEGKQYHFCPHAVLQSTQNESFSKGLKGAKSNSLALFIVQFLETLMTKALVQIIYQS